MSKTVLITGANRGIGLELSKQYAEQQWNVLACARNPQEATELKALKTAYPQTVAIYSLDMTNEDQINDLAQQLASQAIDILICNAGIYGPSPCNLNDTNTEQWLNVFHTNVIGPQQLCAALHRQVANSQQKLVAMISSKMGSIEDNQSGGSYIYRSSKTALNQVTRSLAIDLKAHDICVISLHPGWVKTDMGGPNALIESQASAQHLQQTLDNIQFKDSGLFFNYDGNRLSW